MTDVLVFAAPLGILGLLAEKLFLRPYLERMLMMRAVAIRAATERPLRSG